MNINSIKLIATCLTLLWAANGSAQQFSVETDSLEKSGYIDSLVVFENIITNHWDQENVILWVKEEDVPERWFVEICQGTRHCWGPWIMSDTLVLPASEHDSLLVKFVATDNPGTGQATIFLTALADTNIRQQYTFVFHAISLGVDRPEHQSGHDDLSWDKGSGAWGGLTRLAYNLPGQAWVKVSLYDMVGRNIAQVWEGQGRTGSNTIQNVNLTDLSTGVYILHLETDGYGAINRKVVLVR